MNQVYERNNIYFLLENNNCSLLLDQNNFMLKYPTLKTIGSKKEIYNNENLILGPIDFLLFYIPQLEYLNRNYNQKEFILRKNNLIAENEYKRLKYYYHNQELNYLYEDLKKINIDDIYQIINDNADYFYHKKDSVIKIYTKSL